MENLSYSSVMDGSTAYLEFKLDLDDPVEIGDFAALFSGLGGQFESYLKDSHPEVAGAARLYVKEVRHGSIVADLFALMREMIGYMDDTIIVLSFAALFSRRVRAWIAGQHVLGMNKTELRDANDTLRAIANAKSGKAVLKSYKLTKGVWQSTVEAEFSADEARQALKTVGDQVRALDKIEGADHQRVLMVFTRPDSGDAQVGKSTGEKVLIEQVSSRKLPLIYASDLAGQEIKHEMRDADQNIFKRGFVVDVNVATRNGKPVAYSVTNLHQIIDLPDEDEQTTA